ncbi:hypothetical protein OZD68_00370 [Wolbachia endosymbiont of Drosophila bicornuta]|nr:MULTISPECIES: hypothetical protein [Wolbachia]MBA8754699.1 hypothetical protein [Wolbachia pipientis]MDE5056083.1 hypothetical protein [Wolbachia endosymbiont of Drosophila bicornuta]
MLLLYHSHKHISYAIRTIARSAINCTANGVIPVLDTGIQPALLHR